MCACEGIVGMNSSYFNSTNKLKLQLQFYLKEREREKRVIIKKENS